MFVLILRLCRGEIMILLSIYYKGTKNYVTKQRVRRIIPVLMTY